MFSPNRGSHDANLDALFRAYRDACPDPEPSPEFMPVLWQRIEARQRYSLFFGRLARGFVTAAVALSLAIAVYLSTPRWNVGTYSENYVDALASTGHGPDSLDTELLINETVYPPME